MSVDMRKDDVVPSIARHWRTLTVILEINLMYMNQIFWRIKYFAQCFYLLLYKSVRFVVQIRCQNRDAGRLNCYINWIKLD